MSNILLWQLYALHDNCYFHPVGCLLLRSPFVLLSAFPIFMLSLIIRDAEPLFPKLSWDNEKLAILPTLQEKGNEYVKMGKKHYSDSIDCYTRAINQNALSDAEQSILYSNRAHVNLLLGNYRRALQDAEDATKLNPSNVKVAFFLLCIMCRITGLSFLQVLHVLGVCDIFLYFFCRLFIGQRKHHFLWICCLKQKGSVRKVFSTRHLMKSWRSLLSKLILR